MAASSTPQGYQCEFIESIPEDFHCKQCSLVARALNITTCCGESFCRTCIKDGHPCPGCGEESFKFFPQVKYQQKIAKLQVNCTMKEKGCGWTGALEHLEAHLDPDQGDCQYVDVDCPLKCDEKIEKRNIDQHTANKCVKRDHVCPYCSFKATYEIIHNTHWPECKYYPLMCPNRCGVTCERSEMEYHLNICRLEEVECEFNYTGCKERFKREEWEEHMKDNSMRHLSMVATAAVKDRKEFQRKIEEQEKKLEEQEKKSEEQEKDLKEQEKKFKVELGKLEMKLAEQEKKSEKRAEEQKDKLEEREEEQRKMLKKNLEKQEQKMQEQKEDFERAIAQLEGKCHKQNEIILKLRRICVGEHKFTMDRFHENKRSSILRSSPPMYTHVCGYKFSIDIYANGLGSATGNNVSVGVRGLKGEFDNQLEWPFKGVFTIQLTNHFPGGVNKEVVEEKSWNKGSTEYLPFCKYKFISHAELDRDASRKTHFLKDNYLHFCITDITLL